MALGMLLESGWPECDLSDCEIATVPGTPLKLYLRAGQPHAIGQAFIRDLNEFVEPLMNAAGIGDEGSWTENNSVWTSNHKGAVAWDYNWDDHPVKIKDAGWNGSTIIPGDQVPEVRRLLAYYEGMVYWGNDWHSFIDSMHFQLGYDTFGAENFARVDSFIQRKIRADGYSTYRRGGVPRGGGTAVAPSAPANPITPVVTGGLTAAVLWEIAGQPKRMPLAKYEELLPWVTQMFHEAQCHTIDRRAMLTAQVFHEAGALYYTEEIASGDAYDTRTDLGNTPQVDGDGALYKGRGWIQLTGKSNYAGFSGWMFRNGRAPTADHFLVNPHEVARTENCMWATVYYWIVARPQLNGLADGRNIEQASRVVNGTNPKTGRANGIEDRIAFYQRALAANEDLLDPPADELEELLMANAAYPSWSPYATPGEPDVPLVSMIRALDAVGHRVLTEDDARGGDPEAIRRLARAANGQGTVKTPYMINRATKILNEIYAAHPEFITAAITTAGKA